jgi:hypothetical protein
MASTGFWAAGFRRRGEFSRLRFFRGLFFAARDFLDFFDFLADAFFAARGFAFPEAPTLRGI